MGYLGRRQVISGAVGRPRAVEVAGHLRRARQDGADIVVRGCRFRLGGRHCRGSVVFLLVVVACTGENVSTF